MEQWLDTRRRVLREGVSKRQILRETGVHWTTLEKIPAQPSPPPGYQRRERPQKPKIHPFVDRIREILEQDQHIHRKQRHTAKRIWERLQEEEFTGGYPFCRCRSRRSRPVGFSRPRSTPNCWFALMTTTTRCRWNTPIGR